MSVDSNRCQVLYCSTAGLPPASRPQSSVQETQSAVDSTTPSPSPSPPSPSYPPPPPLLLIRPLTTQPSSSSSSTTATTTTTRSLLPPQSLSSIPPPAFGNGRGKMINITITRKKLKVTSGGTSEFPVSILKPLANVIRSAGGKIKKLDAISIRPPIVSVRPTSRSSSQQRNPPSRPSPPQSQAISQQQQHPPPSPQPPSLIVNNPILPTTTPTLAPNAPSAVQVSPSTLPSKVLVIPEIIELCPYCDTYFYSHKTLAYHMMTVHFSTMVRNVSSCAPCSIVYVDYGSYINHCLQMHCIYPTGTQLEEPITIASPVNPLYRQCNICNLTFPSTKAIAAHFFDHLGPSIAFTCRLCRQQIPSLLTLAAHLKVIHSIQFQLYPQQTSTQCPPKGPSNCLSSISPILPVYST